MEEAETPREYEHKLEAEDFVKLFLSSDEEFYALKEKLLQDNSAFIKRERGQTRLSNVHITGNISIKNVSLNNCAKIFCDHVKIEDLVISGSNLSYLNGKHKTIFNFQDCEIGGIYVNTKSSIGELFIEKDCIVGSVEISNATVANIQSDYSSIDNLSVLHNSKIDDLFFLKVIVNKFKLNSSTNENISIIYSSSKLLEVKEVKCHNLDLAFSVFDYIDLVDSSFNKCSISSCISDSIFLQHLKTNVFTIGDVFALISIFAPNMPQLKLSNSNIPYLKIWQTKEIEVFISETKIGKFDLGNQIMNDKTKISFSNSSFFNIDMKDISILGILFFRKILYPKSPLDFDSFENLRIHFTPVENNSLDIKYKEKLVEKWDAQYKAIQEKYIGYSNDLFAAQGEPTISISHSSLGKTEFTDCPLNEFRFEFSNSKITDCFISGDSIPTKNVHIIGAEPNSIKEHEQKASFYNQFKKIFEAQGDIYHATQFQANWAEEQLKLLKLKRQGEKGWFTTTFSDLWVLRLNRWSNLHGESWPLAFLFLLGTGLVFYLFYLLSIGRLFNGNEIDWNLIGYYFEFLNPAHKLNFIEDNENVNGWTVFVDYFGRVVIAFGIYQFIAAFRKHTKKQ